MDSSLGCANQTTYHAVEFQTSRKKSTTIHLLARLRSMWSMTYWSSFCKVLMKKDNLRKFERKSSSSPSTSHWNFNALCKTVNFWNLSTQSIVQPWNEVTFLSAFLQDKLFYRWWTEKCYFCLVWNLRCWLLFYKLQVLELKWNKHTARWQYWNVNM